MTLEQYTANRNRAQAMEWLSEVGIIIGFRPKRRFRDYALLISVSIGWIFFCCRAVIEVCN